ncbi:MAG: hypothetical protein HY557_05025 [Euryarchaeota archaeon]|nr:hypothetical protein [Euryarchaeota archaeon]
MAERRDRWLTRAWFASWVLLGAVIIAAFFIASFFTDFSAFPVRDSGAVLLLVPLLTGFLLGILLTDAEIVTAAAAGVLSALVAVGLVGVFLFSPVLAGVAQPTQVFAAFSISRIALSTIVLFPLVIVGTVVGRGIGDLFLPSPRVKEQLDQLREETRRWHEALDRLERRQEPGKEQIVREEREGKD